MDPDVEVSDAFSKDTAASLAEEESRTGFVARCRKAVAASTYLHLVSEDARNYFFGIGLGQMEALACSSCQSRSADMVAGAVDSLVCPD